MQPHHTTTPYLVGPHEPDALSALATADARLARLATDPSPAEARLARLIAAYRVQLEKLNRWWVASCPDFEFARQNCVTRLAELTEALAEVQARQRVALRADVDEIRRDVGVARRAVRVDHVMADQFRRTGGLTVVA